ncbi:MAG TPA: aconitase/3-isopropylmalate dehydratase large subunit family protein, partial [Candidatus Omnitrophota bacterium]|nr:aconitase/3-isopropylmalate dehydratase large subunit family protein [Candidatus Omnitrophota bacterium]
MDFAFGQDGTSSIIIDRVREMGLKKLKIPFCMVIDHSAPSPSEGVSRVHKKMRSFASEFNAGLFDCGCGVCHQVIPESGRILPGDLVLGADSHTCTYGALGIFSTGVGSTDLAVALSTGSNWFKVPPTIKIIVTGKVPAGVYPKDIILHIIGSIGANGATYKAIEFSGPVIDSMDIDGRMTMCNLVVEMGAKAGFMPQDKKTLAWLKSRVPAGTPIRAVSADKDAAYESVRTYDISRLVPQVSIPHNVDTVTSAGKLKSVRINEAFLGTCTNGRLADLEAGARLLKNRKVAPGVRFIVAPASRQIMLEALKAGYIDTFIRAGAVVVAPGCGPCV